MLRMTREAVPRPGRGERRALHEIAAGVGHRQRLVDRQVLNRPRVRLAVRVGREVAGDVLDQLARVRRASAAASSDGRQIRPAAAERRDGAAGADAEEAGHDPRRLACASAASTRSGRTRGAPVRASEPV